MTVPRRFFQRFAGAALMSLAATAFAADAYPAHPITIVVPFSAGGGVDAVARLLSKKLNTSLGQPVIVENKAGGSGMIGAAAVVRANKDGYTLLLSTAGETAINQYVYKDKMQYAPDKDLAPIALVARIPNVLVVNPALPIHNMKEFVDYAKQHPGKLTYATSGVGNPQHLNGKLLEKIAGIQMTHVPYRGASGQVIDVISGQVDATFVSYAAAKGYIDSGKLRAIAVTSKKRAAFAPNVPAISEYAPLADYALENWFGLFAPAGTPVDIQQKLNQTVNSALRDPSLSAQLRAVGGELSPMSLDQFRQFVKDESAKFKKIVEDANISVDR